MESTKRGTYTWCTGLYCAGNHRFLALGAETSNTPPLARLMPKQRELRPKRSRTEATAADVPIHVSRLDKMTRV